MKMLIKETIQRAMAEAIYKVIETKRPKIHYKVGAFIQKFSIVLKRILPDKVYEKMLLNHYKLYDLKVPASC